MGERLRQAREAAGLSQQDVASQMRLRVTMVRALEDGQFEDIPGPPPYIRGYLRSYARVVGIDAESLVQQFDTLGITEPEPSLRPQVIREPGHKINPYLIAVVVAIVIAILFGINWFKDGGMFGSGQAEAPAPEMHAIPAPAPANEGTLALAVPEPSTIEAAPADVPGPNGDAATTGTDAAPAEPAPEPSAVMPETPTAPAFDGDILVLRFTQDAWVDVRDGNDERIAYGLMRAGRERRFAEIVFPVRFIVGNIVGTEIEYMGERYDLAPHILPDRTARFTLERP